MAAENQYQYYRDQPGSFNHLDYLYSRGCPLWLKADARAYVNDSPQTLATDGQSVKKWSDSGIYDNFGYMLGESGRPIFKENVLNGLPIISFVKENSHGLAVQQPSNLDIYTPTVFLVGKWYSGSGFMCKGQPFDQGVKHRKMQILPYGTTNLVAWRCGTDAMGNNAAPVANGVTNWNIYAIRAYRNNLINYNVNGVVTNNTFPVNNSALNTGTPGTSSAGLLGIGCQFPTVNLEFSTVDIAEIIILNYIASERIFNGIIRYLADKWALANTTPAPATIPSRGAAVNRGAA